MPVYWYTSQLCATAPLVLIMKLRDLIPSNYRPFDSQNEMKGSAGV